MKIRTQSKKRKRVPQGLQKAAKEAIEETIFWHTCGITCRHTKSGFPDTGAGTGIEWEGRFFIVTANHVINEFEDSDLEFIFRPSGTLDRSLWWQNKSPQTKPPQRARDISIVQRYSDSKYDLAALEVGAELKNSLRFHRLQPDS